MAALTLLWQSEVAYEPNTCIAPKLLAFLHSLGQKPTVGQFPHSSRSFNQLELRQSEKTRRQMRHLVADELAP